MVVLGIDLTRPQFASVLDASYDVLSARTMLFNTATVTFFLQVDAIKKLLREPLAYLSNWLSESCSDLFGGGFICRYSLWSDARGEEK